MRLRRWLEGLLRRPVFDALTNARIHAVVAPYVESVLGPMGFVAADDLKWVRDRFAPIRHVFSLSKYKGGSLYPAWGVSLDFVPHVSGDQIRWHRSNAAARLDLSLDARNMMANALRMSYTEGEASVRRDHMRVIGAAIHEAEAFWGRCETEADLTETVQWLKVELSGRALSFYNFTQHRLAAAFILAKAGREIEAGAELDNHPYRPNVGEKLESLVRAAAAPSSTPA